MSIDTARSTGPMDLEMMAEAKVAADVAHVFQQFVSNNVATASQKHGKLIRL